MISGRTFFSGSGGYHISNESKLTISIIFTGSKVKKGLAQRSISLSLQMPPKGKNGSLISGWSVNMQ